MSILSTFSKQSCHLSFHPWNSSCTGTSVDLIYPAFKGSFKLYSSLFMLSALLRRKSASFIVRHVFPEILQSTLFLSTTAMSLFSLHCLLRRFLGGYYIFTPIFLPVFMACYLCIHIESKKRRGVLGFYLSNLAVDSLYSLLKSKYSLTPPNHGEVMLFSALSSVFIYLYNKKNALDKQTQQIVAMVTSLPVSRVHNNMDISSDGQLVKHTPPCRHKSSCFMNSFVMFLKRYVGGYTLQALINVIPQIIRKRKWRHIIRLLFKMSHMNFGLFIGLHAATLNLLQCYLPRLFPSLSKTIVSVLTGGLSSLTMAFWPSRGLVTYMITKLIQTTFNNTVYKTILDTDNSQKFFYALSSAFVVHLIVFVPGIVKPSYIRSLSPIIDNKLSKIQECASTMF